MCVTCGRFVDFAVCKALRQWQWCDLIRGKLSRGKLTIIPRSYFEIQLELLERCWSCLSAVMGR